MESGDAMESGARDVLSLCARMNAHFSVGSGSPSCRLDSEPIAAIDSASVEAAAIWIMPSSLSTPDLESTLNIQAHDSQILLCDVTRTTGREVAGRWMHWAASPYRLEPEALNASSFRSRVAKPQMPSSLQLEDDSGIVAARLGKEIQMGLVRLRT
uniref:Uncharacterized protein n=1 Tax=Oryza glumipatula TaxID=40148 RepID=A0A0E0BSL2_9ORYZ